MENEILEKINERLTGLENILKDKKEVMTETKEVKPLVKELDAIFILGRGQSLTRCPETIPDKTEFWGCNNIYRARKLSRLFVIKSPYLVRLREPNLINEINEHDFPVYTLGLYPEFNNNVKYPLEEIIKEFNTGYILNTASYMLALAIMMKPKRLLLFGVDMSYGTNNEYMYNEKACLEGWLGMALGRGIQFDIAQESTLLKRKMVTNFYGYNVINDGPSTRIEPKYSWPDTRGLCAKSYKLEKVHHNI